MEIEQKVDIYRGNLRKAMKDLVIIFLAGLISFIIGSRFDVLEKIYLFSRSHEQLELDELISISVILLLGFMLFSFRRWREARDTARLLQSRNRELGKALSEIKQLQGIIPICAVCKKIRDDTGFWQNVETYIKSHSDADFSHGICPDCMKKTYPEYF